MMTRLLIVATGVVLAASVLACGDDSGDDGGGADKVWADMDSGERTSYMTGTVVPAMSSVFKEHDPGATVSCTTCHPSAGTTGYAMPDPGLPAFEESWLDGSNATGNFMRDRVSPEMADLLGQTFNADGSGDFTCFSCHPGG